MLSFSTIIIVILVTIILGFFFLYKNIRKKLKRASKAKIRYFTNVTSDSPQTKKNSKKYIVCVLGWAGAQMKHLVKFCDVYSKQGIPSLAMNNTYIPGLINTEMVNNQNILDFLEILVKHCNESKSGKIIFHIFSGTGYFYILFLNPHPFYRYWTFYGVVVNIMKKKKYKMLQPLIHSIVYDSAPPTMSIDTGVRAYVSALKSNTMQFGLWKKPRNLKEGKEFTENWLLTPLFKVFCTCLYAYMDIENVLNITFKTLKFFVSRNKINRLYIYSHGDFVCPVKAVKQYVKEEKLMFEDLMEKNVITEELIFKDSPHVSHYKTYPKEYVNKMKEFYKKAFGEEVFV